MSHFSTFTMRSLRLPPSRRAWPLSLSPSRCYSVRVLQDPESPISTVSDLISSTAKDDQGVQVQVDGWVRNVRKSSAVRFLDISDGSSSTPLQAVVKKELMQE